MHIVVHVSTAHIHRRRVIALHSSIWSRIRLTQSIICAICLGFEQSGKSKITDFSTNIVTLAIDEYVLRLEVSLQNVMLVDLLHALDDLRENE